MDCAGFPIGFQLIGRPWQEASLLAAARCDQQRMRQLCTLAHTWLAGADRYDVCCSAIEACVRSRLQLPKTRYDVLYGKQV